MRLREATVLPGLLWLLGAALTGCTILQGIAPHDEGLMLQAGARIAHGQWIYRDFWLNYPPGQPVVLAGLQLVFGPSLLAWRVLRVALAATAGVLAFSLVRDRGAPRWSAGLAWLAVTAALAWPTGPGPNPTALVLVLAGLLAAGRDRPLLAGGFAGLAFTFRFELGVAALVAVIVLADGRAARRRTALAGAAAALLPLVPFLIVAPGALWHDTFGFYAIQSLQRVPFPLAFHGALKPNKLLEFYLPLVLLIGCAAYALRLRDRFTLALTPLVLVSLAYLLGRTDEFHLVPLSALLPMALLAEAPESSRRYARAAREYGSRAVGAVAIAVTALIALYGLDRQAELVRHPVGTTAVPGPIGDGVRTSAADAAQLRALRAAVSARLAPGAPIFVAGPRHDRVAAGNPLLYLILGHPNPTRYDVMQPGLVTTASVQREIVGELAATRVVVRWLDPRAEAGAPATSGAHVLDRFLAARFRPVARFGVYQLLAR